MNRKTATIINNKIKALQVELKRLTVLDFEFKTELTKIQLAKIKAESGIKILNQILEEDKTNG